MTDLTTRLLERLAFDEKYNLKESYAHCLSQRVRNQINPLDAERQALWFAGHHCGLHEGVKIERARIMPLIEELVKCVGAVEAWSRCGYEHVDTSERALIEALARLESLIK
jgi:hypothetical protein